MSTNAIPVHPPVRVLVLGHSYVRRLQDYLNRSGQPAFGLHPAGHAVRLWGVGGLRFPGLLRCLRRACAPGYDVVVLISAPMTWRTAAVPSCWSIR